MHEIAVSDVKGGSVADLDWVCYETDNKPDGDLLIRNAKAWGLTAFAKTLGDDRVVFVGFPQTMPMITRQRVINGW